jgi:hypothetical protein
LYGIVVERVMTKKKKVKPMKKKAKVNPELNHLTSILKYTERNITNDGSNLNSLFTEQAERIKKRIRGLE